MATNASTGQFFPVETIDFGPTGSPDTFNELNLPVMDNIGWVTQYNGKAYRLVQHDKGSGSVATVAGGSAYWKTKASYIVTMDATDAEFGLNSVAGGYLRVVTDQYYCFIQIGGRQTGVSVDASTSIGRCLSGGATDGQLVSTAVSTAAVNLPVAIAVTAASGGTATVEWLIGATL